MAEVFQSIHPLFASFVGSLSEYVHQMKSKSSIENDRFIAKFVVVMIVYVTDLPASEQRSDIPVEQLLKFSPQL